LVAVVPENTTGARGTDDGAPPPALFVVAATQPAVPGRDDVRTAAAPTKTLEAAAWVPEAAAGDVPDPAIAAAAPLVHSPPLDGRTEPPAAPSANEPPPIAPPPPPRLQPSRLDRHRRMLLHAGTLPNATHRLIAPQTMAEYACDLFKSRQQRAEQAAVRLSDLRRVPPRGAAPYRPALLSAAQIRTLTSA
jgi:hypothetical protein